MQNACAVLLGGEGGGFVCKQLNMKSVFRLSLQLLRETFLIPQTEQDTDKNVHLSSYEIPVIHVRFE